MHHPRWTAATAIAVALIAAPAARADNVVADDQIVQGSLCTGLDCVANESFGFDSLRLKENNVRIGVDDTSSSAGFAANDWRFSFNGTGSGAANYFGVDDVTGAHDDLLRIDAGAPSNSIRVGGAGNVGLGTDDPKLRLHIRTTDTPAIRLEQTSGGGFTPQTWDIGANEANWFVRDLTGGSRLPLRIRPGAPTSAVDIAASGDVGLGTASPEAALHVKGAGAAALVETSDGTDAPRTLTELRNAGAPQMAFTNTTADAADWLLSGGDAFTIGTGAATPLTLTANGGVVAGGALEQPADGTENATPVDVAAMMTTLRGLKPVTAEYAADAADRRHLFTGDGFGLGSASRIAPADLAGVALVAAQQLDSRVTALETKGGPKGDTGAAGTPGAQGPAGTAPDVKALKAASRRQAKQIKALRKANRTLAKRVRALARG